MTPDLPAVLDLHDRALARLRQQAPAAVKVYGDTPADDESRGAPYIIVDPDPGWDSVARADGKVTARTGRFRLRCCGSGTQQAAYALDKARAAFLNWRPYPDLRFGMARETDAGPLIPDKSVPTDTRYSFTLTYEIDD